MKKGNNAAMWVSGSLEDPDQDWINANVDSTVIENDEGGMEVNIWCQDW